MSPPDRRTPRAYLKSAPTGDDRPDAPAVSPALVEYLAREFPIEVSPVGSEVVDQAEQRGRWEVIQHLHTLSQQQKA